MGLQTINSDPMLRDVGILSGSSLSTAAVSFVSNIMPIVQFAAVVVAILSGLAALYLTHLKIKAIKTQKK